jgi:hypothetical protein
MAQMAAKYKQSKRPGPDNPSEVSNLMTLGGVFRVSYRGKD